MDYPLCDHLADYREQLRATEDAYRTLAAAVANRRRSHAAKPHDGTATAELQRALANWLAACQRLRSLLVELVAAGRVLLPRRKAGLPRCRVCRCAVHRLEFADWEFLPDGSARFRGEELRSAAAAEPIAAPAG